MILYSNVLKMKNDMVSRRIGRVLECYSQAHLPRLFRTHFAVLCENFIAADFGVIKVFFFFIENGILCVLIRIASIRRF